MNNIRPVSLADFVGQPSARRILGVLISAAKKRGEPVPHLLLSGPPGLGKTSLARILAHEMGGRLIELIGSSVKNPHDMAHQLSQLKANDVMFVDELHALPRKVEELLYPAMEDGTVTTNEKGFDDLVKQLGIRQGQQATKTHRLPAFTLVGATTLLGLTTAPLRSRFRQIIELEPYSVTDLQQIVLGVADKLAFVLPPELAAEIAKRSRGTARTAVSNLYWVRDVVQGDGDVATDELVRLAFDLKGVDENGLTRTDREYLERLVGSEEPVGAEALATALEESIETVTGTIEPFLLREGYINRTPRGRVATDKARALFQGVTA
jgi:Holliday junction DNA helicase RuvB